MAYISLVQDRVDLRLVIHGALWPAPDVSAVCRSKDIHGINVAWEVVGEKSHSCYSGPVQFYGTCVDSREKFRHTAPSADLRAVAPRYPQWPLSPWRCGAFFA